MRYTDKINGKPIEVLIWIGVVFCLNQSGTFSEFNLALFTLTRLRIEVEVSNGSQIFREEQVQISLDLLVDTNDTEA